MIRVILSFGEDCEQGKIKTCDLANYDAYQKELFRLAKDGIEPIPENRIKEAIKEDSYWDCMLTYSLRKDQTKDGKEHKFRFVLDSEMDLPHCTFRYYDETNRFPE